MSAEVQAATSEDKSENDRNDTLLINELYSGRVDILITEDRGLIKRRWRSASRIGFSRLMPIWRRSSLKTPI
jgi:predicted nucleic acid-binding protein